VTPTAWERWKDRIRAVAPGVVPRLSDPRLSDATAPHGVGFDDGPAQVAWVTFDIWADRSDAGAWLDRMAAVEGLEWCHTSSAGIDHPAYRALAERGVTLSASHVTGGPIADYVLRAGLDALQEAGAWRAAQAAGEWRRHGFREMADTTWLVIGLGAIGSQVVTRAQAFGARVVGCRRSPVGDEGCDLVVTPDQLPDVVGQADVVVLAAPAGIDGRPLVDRGLLARVRPGAILINVARGQLVDEEAMVAALDEGRLATAVLDVFIGEPLPAGHRLWTHPKVVVTPHDSSSGSGREERAAQVFLEELARWRDGDPLAGQVRP
jgi:phosphoglycerate dehydrogenase-like enzyme